MSLSQAIVGMLFTGIAGFIIGAVMASREDRS